MLTVLQIGALIVLGFIFVTQILLPAVKGQPLFPTFREPEQKPTTTTQKEDNANHS